MDIRRADKIAQTLEQLVFSGTYRDGERLDELKLAEQFKVSRTPIREALHVLVASGMAEQIPRRGVFVRQPGPVELMEMFETMAELEAACGRLAATRITEDMLAQLVEANVNCHQAVENLDHDLYYDENERFHQIIYRGSANGYLEKQALQLQNRLRAYRRMQLRFRGRLDQSMAEHLEIVSALQNEDADRAANALRSHVAVQGEKFHRLMASLKN
ncbi:GntR family transcriptional regulator [Sulfitobacter geojensis]|uniref:GntR family transcriptional regulator n=1 Tax=Sulfitobacter geojensis TaxID=1342299 RepID=A0AAE3B6S6_9RHOB|nr:GntR family transcriptional regulator [Sulfitobacter geojensis]MBM1690226.1 GntR family transcriptional regulator [Sulfitobacter geojensis]MBM1694292.1 GntR family transcriptional regulator [Sulfitobacter geojensis]MBM1706458.1 GntR family transcriptional regulator [Sulfitobacter geojensis]MBM1710516.1 GntR family transcriptional regulator [Sulfitobacter geojensis]MBM1714582.1 GntR family transcriptional regulator [Sulfitobacter geojensis]